MPELPEVVTVTKYLKKDVLKHKIKNVIVKLPKLIKNVNTNDFIAKLTNQTIQEITNIGKFIVFHLTNNIILLSHLRMEGKYRFEKKYNFSLPIKHDHVIFSFNHGFLIYADTRQFGTFHIFDKNDYLNQKPLNKLAPLPEDLNYENLFKKLQQKKISIKTSLLDQTIILGLGNIYVDEVLFITKIHPLTKSCHITKKQTKEILKNAKKIFEKAIKHEGSSIKTYLAYNNIKGSYQKYLKVHNRKDLLCFQCQRKIQKIKVNGRGTYFCPHCQKIKI